jgi:hypothetical protein
MLALREMLLNLGGHRARIEQHSGQLIVHSPAICVHLFHGLLPRNPPFDSG